MSKLIREEEIKFLDQIKEIIKDNFGLLPQDCIRIELSTDQEDTKESFDLVYKTKVEISVRIRNLYAYQWCDFTIRSRSKWGLKTEIHKLTEGKGSTYLYAWKNKDGNAFHAWMLVNINKIRDELLTSGEENDNGDGTMFKAYKIPWLNSHYAIISYSNLPQKYFDKSTTGGMDVQYEVFK